MSFIKKNIRLVFIFVFSLIGASYFFAYINVDMLWNYGFSYAISSGEIPYKDFNMIVTPFNAFIMAIPLIIFSKNVLVYYIANAFVITTIFYFLFKKYDYKAWLLFGILFFPLPYILLPSYNLLMLLFLVLLIYLEENNKNDYLIGFILGLAILSKQSIGLCFCLVSIYYLFKDYRKVLKRIVGVLVPITIFIIYLLLTNSYKEFFDLCFLGMFDFAGSNGKILSLFFFLSIPLLFIIIKKILKDKNNISNYYILSFYSVMIPLFDINHFFFFFFSFMMIIIDYINIKKIDLIKNVLLFIVSYVIVFFTFLDGFHGTYPNHYNNFQFRNMYNQHGEFIIRDQVIDYLNKNKDKEIIIFSSEAYFYKITTNRKLNYFDLLNMGNHGYKGTEKMIKKIENMDKDNTIFLISLDEYNTHDPSGRQQIDKKIIKYVLDNGELIKEIPTFSVYKLK